MEWRHTTSPIKKKFKPTISTCKIMCTVFWDRKGILLVEFLPQGSTINASAYCDTLKKLHRAIQNKRRGMFSRGVVMLHDDACPHTAAATQNLILTFGWEQCDHRPYSPDLVPSTY
jgi:histone-lysine N-methyltransferase SETMAR